MELEELLNNFLGRHEGNVANLFALNIDLDIFLFGAKVEVETIWYNNIEDQVYLHVGCDEFEGDIKISSLSEENRERIKNCILCQ